MKVFVRTDSTYVPIKAWIGNMKIEDSAMEQLYDLSGLPFLFKHIAVMPDVHMGYGSTVGSVIATKNVVMPMTVGVDIGCFTGDTCIPTLDGKSYPIKLLAEKGKDFYVYSYAEGEEKIVVSQATAKLTRKNARLVKIRLDNGREITCTPDHKFLLRDGNWREAQVLKIKDSLMPFYSRKDKDGYVVVRQPAIDSEQRVHWMVARSGLMGQIPKSGEDDPTIIHHKNFTQLDNKQDNRPENLKFMLRSEHSRLHRESGISFSTLNHSQEFQEKRQKGVDARRNNPASLAQMIRTGTKNITKYMKENREDFLNKISDNGGRGKKYLIAYNQSEKGREKSREISTAKTECPLCDLSSRGYFGLMSHIRNKHKIKTLREAKAAALINHKVISIEYLSYREDVFCLHVPKFHNFALDAGVFVHNCGMAAVKLSISRKDLPENLSSIRASIEEAVPHGRTNHGQKGDRGAWGKVPEGVEELWELNLEETWKSIVEFDPVLERNAHPANHLGTLGSGNHFIEVCVDTDNAVWIMLHSGSRGPGNRIGSHFSNLAKEEMTRWFIELPHKDLAFLPEGHEIFQRYFRAVIWAQRYAKLNRDIMLSATYEAIKKCVPAVSLSMDDADIINCHHNYIAKEHHFGTNVWVTRKGAVRAREGDMGIIPGSMGAKSFIVRGKGNPESFCSCSHGAGRVMSRTKARATFTVADHEKATEGVECRKDKEVLDETPGAYKDISEVMAAQESLVEVVHELKQIICVKG